MHNKVVDLYHFTVMLKANVVKHQHVGTMIAERSLEIERHISFCADAGRSTL
jgi:hypothetical protein